MTRMFAEVGRTWNFIVGCEHGCTYCCARDLALGRLKHLPQYLDDFRPVLVPWQLWSKNSGRPRRFKGGVIFPCFMGDMMGEWVPHQWIEQGIEVMRCSPNATFLLLTKNPWRYHEFLRSFPENVILGATIESDIDHGVSKAPVPLQRAEAMRDIHWFRKFIAIEPIMDFDIDSFPRLVEKIRPEFVYLGLDNWNHHLPEPPLEKTEALIQALREFTEVRLKTIRKAWYEQEQRAC